MNILLFGMMGAGKSTVGALLAESLGFQFLDMDEEIAKKEGRSISEIFSQSGEDFFRNLELKFAQETKNLRHHVIATGGGCIENSKTRENLFMSGLAILLTGEPELLYSRIKESKDRPLLAGRDPEQSFYQIYQRRQATYNRIKCQIMLTPEITPEKLAYQIKCLYRTTLFFPRKWL